MKKNNNSLLLTILGGAIFCFVFLGMAFIFTNSTRIMSGNNTPSLENNEEISLGDENPGCNYTYTYTDGAWVCGQAPSSGYTTAGGSGSTQCQDDPSINLPGCGQCYRQKEVASSTCSSCKQGYAREGNTCEKITISCPNVRVEATVTCTVQHGTINGAVTASDSASVISIGSNTFTVKGNTAGTSSITAVINGQTITGSITVLPVSNPLTSISINGPDTITIGESADSRKFTATLTPTDSDDSLIWSVSGISGSSMSQGDTSSILYATSVGTATVTVRSASNSSVTASKSVHVVARPSISVSPQAKVFIAKDMPVTVTFTAKGEDGNPIPVTWPDPGNSLITKNCSATQTTCSYTFKSNACSGTYPMKGNATDESGNSLVMPEIAARKYNAWDSGNKKTATTQPTERSRESMKWKEGCNAIEDVTKIEEGKWEYTLQNRCCGGGSGTTSPKCYVDEQGAYHWTADKEPSWELVSGVSNKDFCEAQEKDACYRAPDGEYEWGKYAKTEGYTYIASIKNETTCKETGVCYKKNAGDYEYAETKPDACVQVNSCWVPNAEASNPPETCTYTTKDACEEVEGYVEVPDVDKDACLPDAQEACYIRESDGKWSWGDYSNVTGYYPLQYEDGTPVPEEMCSNDVPDVPKTNMNVTQIVYICMAVLMACGVGFIYYSSVMKKNENQ